MIFFRDQYFINIDTIYIKYFFVFVFVEVTYFDFFVVKIYVVSTHSYTLWRKKVKIFYNNFGIREVVIYRCFVLIALIKDYKKCLFT